ncbi:hypothetical protein [Brevibacillus laterosporus]|uniref:hypothetical protein n=1 Tax=Brevibacillus laterosporus TaxID=1465 RepID=UPI0018CD370A|nr:hypothetical protein [Brevibacillus laterosporus]
MRRVLREVRSVVAELYAAEISENENRKEFTFSERVDWARRLEQVERMKVGKAIDPVENLPQGKTRDLVAEQSGFGSGKQYEKAKYIADHADPEIIAQLDDDEISIHRAYTETKRKLAEKEAEVQRLTSG